VRDSLTITVAAGGDDAYTASVIDVMRDTLAVLDALDEELGNELGQEQWRIVEMTKQSPPSITIAKQSESPVVSRFIGGLEAIQEEATEAFSMPVLRPLRRLSRRLGGQVDSLTYQGPQHKQISPGAQFQAHLEEVFEERFFWAPGSVDGRLDVVNLHKNPRFSVFDEDKGREIRCRFPENLMSNVKHALGKRVSVHGRVKYDRTADEIAGVRVDDVEVLDSEGPLSFEDMPAIDITEGEPSEDYVRRLRDAE